MIPLLHKDVTKTVHLAGCDLYMYTGNTLLVHEGWRLDSRLVLVQFLSDIIHLMSSKTKTLE